MYEVCVCECTCIKSWFLSYTNVEGDVVALTMHVMNVGDCDMTLQCRLYCLLGAISEFCETNLFKMSFD